MGSVVFIHGADYQEDRVRLYLHRTRFEVGMEAGFVAAGILDEQQARHSNPVSFDWIEYGELLQKTHSDDGTVPAREAPQRDAFKLGQKPQKYRCDCCPTRKKKGIRNLYSWVGQGGRHMDSLIELVMDQKWSEIKAYLGSKQARAETVERVLSDLPDDVAAVVGHSFGSVAGR